MLRRSRVSDIKRARRESVLFGLVSNLIHQAMLEDARLADLVVSRVELSPGKTMCTVYFYTAQGKEHFDALLAELKLYKPSMRQVIAREMNNRYAVDLVFRFDTVFEKTQRIEQLLDKVTKDESLAS